MSACRVETGRGWELRLGDCLDPQFGISSAGGVDHTITDPPYASAIYQRCKKNPGRNSGRGRGHRGTNKYSTSLKALADGAIGTLDDVLSGAMSQIAVTTQRWAIVFCDAESISDVIGELTASGEMKHVRVGAWWKPDPMPQFSGDRPAQGFEACVIAHGAEEKMRWNGRGKPALWRFGVCKQDRPDHPCPKPLGLMEALVREFTDPGDSVCDPFAGSGTTGVACIRNGRRFIGWEKDPRFYEVALARLRAAREQVQIFDASDPGEQIGMDL